MPVGVKVSTPMSRGVRRTAYPKRKIGMIHHILSKVPVVKGVNIKKRNKYSSVKDDFKIEIFTISEEVEREYNLYKLRKRNRDGKRTKSFSFYNNDGSFNCVGILLGMCSDDDYIRERAIALLIVNLEKILNSEDFRDLTTFIFSCSVFIYFYCDLFFNVTEFAKYNLGLIL